MGSISEFRIFDESRIAKVGKSMSLKRAAALTNVALTSLLALSDKCPITHTVKTILILGGGSSTGKMGLSIARSLSPKARIIAVCSNETVCKEYGASEVINWRKESLSNGLKRLKVTEIDLVYETIRTEDSFHLALQHNCKCFVTIDPGLSLLTALKTFFLVAYQGIASKLFNTSQYHFFMNEKNINSRAMKRLEHFTEHKLLKPLNDIVEYDFSTRGVNEALRHVREGKGGKVVIRMDKK